MAIVLFLRHEKPGTNIGAFARLPFTDSAHDFNLNGKAG